ncbi:hypothetical protein FO440_18440 [Mucilaginibacter corticis]|uniref:Uncharacterized protein n=1 Tax=Mucilaginibacter corticis TaxID=2597670 RepID=A0A556MIH9_9SPHI|nr:hypothetical protein [Mucilaginibacter corticis]TSJ39717.1 hypothetical protein FO440_18440 [Mucilaginibacter corticis]
MKIKILISGLFLSAHCFAQEYVVDPKVYESVLSNAAVRSSAEVTHQQYLGKISTSLDNINLNVGSVVLAQTMIYEALSNVNSALKNGLAVKNLAVIVADITSYSGQCLTLARSDPALLLFATNISAQMKLKATALVGDVSGSILNSGGNMLADYNARDELLRKVITQLQVLDGLAYGAWRAMYWAREKGTIAALNPFAGFIYKDKLFVQQIISNAKYLK